MTPDLQLNKDIHENDQNVEYLPKESKLVRDDPT